MLTENVLYYGRDQPLPVQRRLRAGPLSLVYEEGDLRYIRLDDQEILRRVYVALRDRNWGTVAPVLSNVRINAEPDSFQIAYDVRNRQDEIDFAWSGTITGDTMGTIRFRMDGEARSDFLRNRIGFCVLHPGRECPGRPCVVERADGTVERGTFPRFISPHQPFKEMRSIAHEVAPGFWAEVRFEGDVFEMEDQRNWTDASYKTYCTPLALPYPVQVCRGDRVSQSVKLTLTGGPMGAPASGERPLTLSLTGGPEKPLPGIGLGVASHGQPLSPRELNRLRALQLAHLRVDLKLSQPDHAAELRRAASEASALDVPLEVALIVSDQASEELNSLAALVAEIRPRVCRWLVFHDAEHSTSERWVRLVRARLAAYDPSTPIGAGSNAYFTELNRVRPPVEAIEFVCFSMNPQVHAFDNASLTETLEAQAATVESAREIAGTLPVVVSPVTLRPRFNPNATGPVRESGPGELPSQVDPRQMSLFGAGWTAGSLKYLTQGGAASITYYETTGWRGVMETEAGSPEPEVFGSEPGTVFPLYHVLADVGEFSHGCVVPTQSSDPLRVDGLMLWNDRQRRWIVANLGPQPEQVRLPDVQGPARVRRLERTTAEAAMRSPEEYRSQEETIVPAEGGALTLELSPFSVVCLDEVHST